MILCLSTVPFLHQWLPLHRQLCLAAFCLLESTSLPNRPTNSCHCQPDSHSCYCCPCADHSCHYLSWIWPPIVWLPCSRWLNTHSCYCCPCVIYSHHNLSWIGSSIVWLPCCRQLDTHSSYCCPWLLVSSILIIIWVGLGHQKYDWRLQFMEVQ